MTEKPLVVLLQSHTKIGKQVFNFDKFTLSLNYRISSKGVTLEISPPQQKKMIDYKKFISPYKVVPRCPSCSGPLKMKRTNENTKAFSKAKIKSVQEPLKKLSVQEVFNFSETPINLVASFHRKPVVQIFPKSKDFSSCTMENVYKFINMDNRDDSIDDTRVFSCNTNKIVTGVSKATKKSLNKSKSQMLPSVADCSSRTNSLGTCKSCVIVLRNKVDKLHKENLSLRRRLHLIRSI